MSPLYVQIGQESRVVKAGEISFIFPENGAKEGYVLFGEGSGGRIIALPREVFENGKFLGKESEYYVPNFNKEECLTIIGC